MQSSTPKSSKKRSCSDDDEDEAHERSNGLDEIDALFANKKHEAKQKANVPHDGKKQQHPKHSKRTCTISSRQDLEKLDEKEWVDDGLGGKFNREGYTGRREDGVRIYKAHLLNKKDFGNSPICPFDCDCCYI